MAFDLPLENDDPEHPWPPCAVETMWVEVLGDDLYRIDNIPFFVKPLAVDDIVRGRPGESRDDLIQFVERVEWRGRSTVRIIVFANEDEILATLQDIGCSYERVQAIIAVDIPDEQVLQRAHAFLLSRQERGDLDLEEACLPDSFLD
ncbi:hypothetical protein M2272_002171 [Mycobacterium frederiksbergense]|uniref:DUF4265 domain-containing protein n=1 Tax=Mycolicibacterium frederiksbergense TaxID=117567 RepID=A0ABT6KXV7_9MYCO|nr:DUF4265 domain-containing protein [Mycolicibacterium frederiksbergense]MDH6195531.1 hypothetical protein [Mycolicibacterium frederiksbergense]